MKRKLIIGITVFSLLMTGCQTKVREDITPSDSQEITQENTQENNVIASEKDEAEAVDYQAEKEALLALINEGRFAEYIEVLPNYLNDFNQEDIDELFIKHFNYLESNLLEEINLYYSEALMGIHEEIGSALASESRYVVFGESKLTLVDDMKTEAFKDVVKRTLEKGYALYNGEGSYYPQIDYIELANLYEGKVSESFSAYLNIMGEELKQPLTVEEYLAVDLETLKSRMYQYEAFLQSHGKSFKQEQPQMFENVRILFSVAIWNTVNPNVFNGLIGDDFYPTQSLVDFYQGIISESQYPITTEAASRILKIIEENRDLVFGSFENLDQLYPMSQNIADDLNMKLEMSYN